MFKKLKEKISEEVRQSPSRISASVSQLAQAVVSPSSSSIVEPTSVTDNHFTISEEVEDSGRLSTPTRGFTSVELQNDASPQQSTRSRRSSTNSVLSDIFPSFESSAFSPTFHIQSDLESASELDDSLSSQLGTSSKDQLVNVLRKTQQQYNKYKGRYTDLARHYRILERENIKAKTVLTESQDKALRRIAELKEQCTLEQRAKAHLEEVLRNDLEEKDHLIMTLNTKIDLLKLNENEENYHTSVDGATTATVASESVDFSQSLLSDQLINLSTETNSEEVAEVNLIANHSDSLLQEKVAKLESLLVKCKDSIKLHKTKVKEFSVENTELKLQLDRQKSCSKDLEAARDELKLMRQRDEEAALSMAETKRSIHSEMELKEDQIKHLRQTIDSLNKEKVEVVSKCNELRSQLSEVNRIQEFDVSADNVRQIQELSRVKQEAVRLLQAETSHKIKVLHDEMAIKEQTFNSQIKELSKDKEHLLTSVSALQMQLKEMEDNCRTRERNEKNLESSNQQLEATVKQLDESNVALREQIVGFEASTKHLQEVKAGLEKQLIDVKNAKANVTEERDALAVQAFQVRSREIVYQYSLLEELSRIMNLPECDTAISNAEVSNWDSLLLRTSRGQGIALPSTVSQLSPPINEMENSECDQHMESDRHAQADLHLTDSRQVLSALTLQHLVVDNDGMLRPEAEDSHYLSLAASEAEFQRHSEAVKRLNEAKVALAVALEKKDRVIIDLQHRATVLQDQVSLLETRPSPEDVKQLYKDMQSSVAANQSRNVTTHKYDGPNVGPKPLAEEYQEKSDKINSMCETMQHIVEDESENKQHSLEDIKKIHADCMAKANAEIEALEQLCEEYKTTLQVSKDSAAATHEKNDTSLSQKEQELTMYFHEKECKFNDQLLKMQSEIDKCDCTIRDMGIEREEQASKQEALVTKISTLEELCGQFNNQLNLVTQQNTVLANETNLLKAKNKDLESLQEATAKELTKKEEELSGNITVLREQIEAVTVEKTGLVEELSRLESKNKELLSNQEKNTNELMRKQVEYNEISKKLLQIEEMSGHISVVQQQLEAITQQNANLVQEKSILEEEKQELVVIQEANAQELMRSKKEMSEHILVVEKQLNAVTLQKTKLVEKLKMSESKNRELVLIQEANAKELKVKEELSERVTILEEQLKVVTFQKTNLIQEMSQLEVKNNELALMLDANANELGKIEQMSILISDIQEQLNTVSLQNTGLTQVIIELEEKNKNLVSIQEANIKKLTEKEKEMSGHISDLQEQLNTETLLKTELVLEISRLEAKNKELATNQEANAKEVARKELEYEGVCKKLFEMDTMSERISELEKQLHEASVQKTDLAQEVSMLEAKIKELICNQEASGKELARKELENDELCKTLFEMGTMSGHISELQRQLHEVSLQKADLAQEVSMLEAKNKELVSNQEANAEEMTRRECGNMEEMCGHISVVQEQLKTVTVHNTELVKEMNRLEAKNKELTLIHESNATELALKKEMSRHMSELQEELNTVTLHNTNLVQEMSILRAKNRELAVIQEAHTKELIIKEEMIGHMSILEEQLKTVNLHNADLVQEVNVLKAKTKELALIQESSANELAKKHVEYEEISQKLNDVDDLSRHMTVLQEQLKEVIAEKELLVEKLHEKETLECVEDKIQKTVYQGDMQAIDVSSSVEKQSREELAKLLEDSILAIAAKDEELVRNEELHCQKIKQLVKEFDNKLHDREEELTKIQDDEMANEAKTESRHLKHLKGQLKAMKSDTYESQQLINDLQDKITEMTEIKERYHVESKEQVASLREIHQKELAACDQRWRQCLDRELEAREISYKEELNALGKEWEWERKELSSTSQVAVAAVESGTGSMELMQQQLMSMSHQLNQQKLEITSLRKGMDSRLDGEDRGSTELEYLRNIVFQYMMGRDPTVLAKVISTVLKFNKEETDKVMEKEELKLSLLGQLRIL